MKKLVLLVAFMLASTTACTVNMVDKEIIDQAYVATGNAKKIRIRLESRFDFGVITLRPVISGDYQRISVTTIKETRQEKYIAGEDIASSALGTAMLGGLPLLLLLDEDYTWFECENTAECSEEDSVQYEEKKKNGLLNQPVHFMPDEIDLSIVAANGIKLAIPLNADGVATTSLRELDYPKNFSVKVVYAGQAMTKKLHSPEHYLASVDGRTITVSTRGQSSEPERVIPAAELFRELDELVDANMQRYLQSVSKPYIPKAPFLPMVPEPAIPPPPTLVKSDFETRAEFQRRVQVAIDQRDSTAKALVNSYRKQVENRNQRMQDQMVDYNASLASLNEQYTRRWRQLQESVADEQELQYLLAIPDVFGEPLLRDLQYNAEQRTVHANLAMGNSDYSQAVWWQMPAGKAEKLFSNRLDANIEGEFTLRQIAGNSLSRELLLHRASIGYEDRSYLVATESAPYFSDQFHVDLKEMVPSDVAKLAPFLPQKSPLLAEMTMQSAALVEQLRLSADDYVKEREESVGRYRFNDDIPTLLSKVRPSDINKHRRLIVVGIENYRFTDPIAFSRRSAELFVQVAQKTLGVSPENTLSLIDYGATSGALKDSLRLFLQDIDERGEIVFYYSGHGIPDPGNQNEPYILPIDKAPSFVSEDKAFQLAYIYKQLSDSGANKVVAIIDSCFSGVTDGKSSFDGVAAARLVPRAIGFNKEKMVVLTAGKGTQFSNMYREKGNRLFSYYVMKSLLKGRTDVETLYQEVSVQVKDVSRGMGLLYRQEPEIRGNTLIQL